MSEQEQIKKLKEALKVAADALSIASDWNVNQVQVNPPKEWDLDGGDEDPEDGWCSTSALARKLRQLSN
jgi:hypothetical protein